MNDLSKTPIVNLWGLIKDVHGLYLGQNVFLRAHEQADSDRENGFFVVLRDEMSNGGRIYGGGEAKVRKTSNDIILTAFDDGSSQSGAFMEERTLIEKALGDSGVEYSGVNLGWDGTKSEYAFDVTLYA